MSISRSELEQRYAAASDEELLMRGASGDLSELAQDVVDAEVRRRGLDFAPPKARVGREPEGEPEDLVILTRAFDPTEAYLLRGLLESEGVPSFVADGNLVQANPFLTVALGFVRVLVPESRLDEARDLLARFRAGEFALADDVDVEGSGPEPG